MLGAAHQLLHVLVWYDLQTQLQRFAVSGLGGTMAGTNI